MKPVVVLTLISSALRGKRSKGLPKADANAPMTHDQARHEIAVAVTAIVVVLALIVTLVLSVLFIPEL